MNHFDLFVIGAGSGGVRAARMSAAMGAKVAVAEAEFMGGTCVNVGCVPKKLFVYASEFGGMASLASTFGHSFEHKGFDWSTLLLNKNNEIERLNGIYKNLLTRNNVKIIEGFATFVSSESGKHQIEVNGTVYTADNVIIAVGAEAVVPNMLGAEHAITSKEAFYLKELPKSVSIIGGGYIAVEFAGIFNSLGVKTNLIIRSEHILKEFDQGLQSNLTEAMKARGINIVNHAQLTSIEKNKDSSGFQVITASHAPIESDLVMFATGRKPYTGALNLAAVNVETDDAGAICVNDSFQTSHSGIYAIGDCINRVQLTPVALAEGMFLAHHLFGDKSKPVNYENIPTAVFSQPNLATVGLTEAQAVEKYEHIAVYESKFTPMKYSFSNKTEKTFMKMIVDVDTDKVIGVHMLGSDAGEIIQGIGVAITAGATKAHFDSTIGIHPTSAEEFVTMRAPTRVIHKNE